MDKKKERKLILETVMELKRPFSLSFLFSLFLLDLCIVLGASISQSMPCFVN